MTWSVIVTSVLGAVVGIFLGYRSVKKAFEKKQAEKPDEKKEDENRDK